MQGPVTSDPLVVIIEVLHKVPQHLYVRNGPEDVGTGAEGQVTQGNSMLEFHVVVDDAAPAYVMPPRTLAWGNRPIYFRYSDGNLINFFTP